ncbi:isopentenyl-diphosphate Delta-isomerase [Ruicaihuangia caeni]|uniref:Isopentenyl-diphosphate Delta-isomerase n=1 Tax=Ruicaihuangia caeni TaxID=3042517 RepID=A0AAW6TBX2_9MICO|nr:isopentenyl-diphosphate Delta-isomerase [Klugiella sp. YN-L-19]MDI2098865.1 isopentenyl-diphosphate Delta-isomerase [Klugiella sp. YN-L-19]
MVIEGSTRSPERVVLLDDERKPAGAMPKHLVHGEKTPLHLAFSCHVVDDDGRVLVTRRALSKATWPGVWTNAFCGHPGPDEPIDSAIVRRAEHELGLAIDRIEPLLPDFAYRATDASGVEENEFCPVYSARAIGDPAPNPDEVQEYRWVQPDDLARAVHAAPWAFSPWLVWQLDELAGRPRTVLTDPRRSL